MPLPVFGVPFTTWTDEGLLRPVAPGIYARDGHLQASRLTPGSLLNPQLVVLYLNQQCCASVAQYGNERSPSRTFQTRIYRGREVDYVDSIPRELRQQITLIKPTAGPGKMNGSITSVFANTPLVCGTRVLAFPPPVSFLLGTIT